MTRKALAEAAAKIDREKQPAPDETGERFGCRRRRAGSGDAI